MSTQVALFGRKAGQTSRRSRRVLATAAASLLLPALAVISAGTASASVGDPTQTGCASDAYTVSTQPIKNSGGGTVGQVQLRYSPHCGTNWSKAVSTIGTAYIQTVVGSPTDSAYYAATSTSVYTDMVHAPTGVCAAANASINNGPWSAYAIGC
jgi:Protein of unknown function (DUF2690)